MFNSNKYTPKTPRREKSNLSSSSESSKVREAVNVFCRLKGLKDAKDTSCIKLISPNVLSISCPTESKVLRKDSQYSFKHIFTSYATQKEVFEHVALPLLEDVLQGKNGLLFTYGVTGSGKTYTLTGEPSNPGVMPRCIDTIFNTVADFQAPKFIIKSDRMNGFEVQTQSDASEDQRIENKANYRSLKKKASGDHKSPYSNDGNKILGINETNLYAVFVSYVEIYNNSVFDLLDESGGKELQSKILREDSQKNMFVNGVVEVEVKSASEAFEMFALGQKRKRMGNTILNSESSRSHSIFNIRVVQWEQEVHNSLGERVIPDKNFLVIGQLSLVDLAGSERCQRTQTTGMRLKEASSINNSLMTLRSCLEILRDNQLNNANRLVPYRDSRLTLLFKRYFEGDGKVQMIVCINPDINDYEENLHVLKFAVLSQDVKIIQAESRYTPYRKPHIAKTPGRTPINRVKSGPILFPKIPTINLTFENCEDDLAQLDALAKSLQHRKQKGATFKRECDQKVNTFRKRLMDFGNEYTIKTTELKSALQQYKNERKKNHQLEVNILESEKLMEILEAQKEELKDTIRSLRCDLNEKDLKLNQNLMERERQKQKMALQQEKKNQELDEKLRKQRQHLNAVMQEKEKKLQKVREVLDENVPPDYSKIKSRFETETQTQPQSPYKPEITPKSSSRTPSARRNNIVVSNRRRSRSAGEVWLEHNSVKPVPLGTVLQPVIKKRKSITQLTKASDITNTKQSKYCLIAQEADTDGEVETMVYKADIVPTCGGGAQVIFNDVERLRQESPVGSPQK